MFEVDVSFGEGGGAELEMTFSSLLLVQPVEGFLLLLVRSDEPPQCRMKLRETRQD